MKILLSVVLACAAVPTRDSSSMTVRISGLETREGSVRIALYGDPSDFLDADRAIRKTSLPVEGDTTVWNLDVLPPGEYALSVFHDENDNRRLDKNPLGIPAEPYGFSNDARGAFGPPDWNAARFELAPGDNRLRIRVR